MSTIAILSSTFPFPPGEQFLETEIAHWGSSQHGVVIIPLTSIGFPRVLPKNVSLDLTVAQERTNLMKILFYVLSPFTTIFARELWLLVAVHKLCPSVVHSVLLSTSRTLHISHSLKHVRRKRGHIDVAYCYWNDIQAYAAVLAKRRGDIGKVATRAHGGDLYEELRPGRHMPLKRQFIEDMDLIAPISRQGRDYFEKTYRPTTPTVAVSRLGVTVPATTSQCSPPGQLSLASVSFCSPGKQIDKIIDAVAFLARAEPETDITWIHIGDGPLFHDLSRRARSALEMLPNVRFNFEGRKNNEEILNYFLRTPVDMFVNASQSEGIPVSIMEAMSCGIPAIATDVGGVKELVTTGVGVLISESPTASEIAERIRQYAPEAKTAAAREAVRKAVVDDFDAKRNYAAFVSAIDDLACAR